MSAKLSGMATTASGPMANWTPEWTLADRLRKLRREIGLSQRDFAAQLDVGAKAYEAWESGINRPRDPVALAKRVELLTRVPAGWVLGLNEPTQPPTPGTDTGMAPYEITYAAIEPGLAQVIDLSAFAPREAAVARQDAAPRVNLDLSA